MANRASRADRAGGADPFPWVVSLGCLVVGLALFLHSTMPALAEQRELEKVEKGLVEQLGQVTGSVSELRRKASAIGSDPEAIRVEIDGHALVPQEAIDVAAPELQREAERAGTPTGNGPR